jgi:hypothetical protein
MLSARQEDWRLALEHIELMAKNQDLSASRRVLDRNNPIRAPQSNLTKSIIRPELQPIRAVSPAVSDLRQAQSAPDRDRSRRR